MRCAIITTVYRKALTVSSVTQSKFSTGEIVNFMSTDTDRIVNFCPSFHAFWSLPFQIAVSLYLLYNQVWIELHSVLCMYVYTCIVCVGMHVCKCVYACTLARECMCVDLHVCMCIARMCTCMNVCVC